MITRFFKEHCLGICLLTIISGVGTSFLYDCLKSHKHDQRISIKTVDGKDTNKSIVQAYPSKEFVKEHKNLITFQLKLINKGIDINEPVSVSYSLPPEIKISKGIGVENSAFEGYNRNITWGLIDANSGLLRAGYSPVITFYLGFGENDVLPIKPFKVWLLIKTPGEVLFQDKITIVIKK